MCFAHSLCGDPPLSWAPREREHTRLRFLSLGTAPSRLFAHLSWSRCASETQAHYCTVKQWALAIGGPLDTREKTGSFVSPGHVGKRRRFIPFFFHLPSLLRPPLFVSVLSTEGWISTGCSSTRGRSQLFEIFEKVGASITMWLLDSLLISLSHLLPVMRRVSFSNVNILLHLF